LDCKCIFCTYSIKGLTVEEQTKPEDEEIPENWAVHAPEIVFDNVYLKYADDLPWVLKGISFVVKPKEKIVVVGRTGAGMNKTSQNFNSDSEH